MGGGGDRGLRRARRPRRRRGARRGRRRAPRRRRPHRLSACTTRASTSRARGRSPRRRSPPGRAWSTSPATSSSAGTGTRALTEDDEPRPGHALRRVQARGRATVPGRGAARAHVAHLRRTAALARRSASPSRPPTACATWPSSPTSCAARSPSPTSPPRCSSSPRSTSPARCTSRAPTRSRAWSSRASSARTTGATPTALRGEPGGPDRPKHIVLDCSRARALLRVRLRGAREVLSP